MGEGENPVIKDIKAGIEHAKQQARDRKAMFTPDHAARRKASQVLNILQDLNAGTAEVTVRVPSGYVILLSEWIDSVADPGKDVFSNQGIAPGINVLTDAHMEAMGSHAVMSNLEYIDDKVHKVLKEELPEAARIAVCEIYGHHITGNEAGFVKTIRKVVGEEISKSLPPWATRIMKGFDELQEEIDHHNSRITGNDEDIEALTKRVGLSYLDQDLSTRVDRMSIVLGNVEDALSKLTEDLKP